MTGEAFTVTSKEELFYMRVGRFRLRQRWLDREVCPSLTAAVAVGIAAGGFVLGFLLASSTSSGGYCLIVR